jgi:hypothetical protein
MSETRNVGDGWRDDQVMMPEFDGRRYFECEEAYRRRSSWAE